MRDLAKFPLQSWYMRYKIKKFPKTTTNSHNVLLSIGFFLLEDCILSIKASIKFIKFYRDALLGTAITNHH